MAKLDTIDNDASISTLSHDDIVAIRRQLVDGQALIRETVDRLRQSQEENEMHTRRRDELESRVSGLEAEYEELLGMHIFFCGFNITDCGHLALTEKTINDEEVSNVDVAESMAELKVFSDPTLFTWSYSDSGLYLEQT